MAKATATFDANDTALQAAFRRIDKSLLGMEKKFLEVGKFAAKLLALPAAAAGGLAIGIKSALDVGGELKDLSARTGVAAGDLLKLQQAFKNAGKEAEDVGPAINKMQKAIATGSGADTISRLGLKLEDLKKQTPIDQFYAIGNALTRVQDPAQKAASSMDLFGKAGGSLLSVFADGGLGEAAGQVGGQAEILSRDADLFDDVSDKLALAGLKVQGFFVGVADKVAPVLKPLLDGFANLDLSQMGQQLGTVIAAFITSFTDGTIEDIIFSSLKMGVMRGADLIYGMWAASESVLWSVLKLPFEGAVAIFQVLTTVDFWKSMGSALMGIAKSFNAFLLDGIAAMLEKLKGIPGIGDKIGGAAESLREKAQAYRSGGKSDLSASGTLLAPVLTKAIRPMAQDMLQAPGAGFSGRSGFYQSAISDEMAHNKDLWTKVLGHVDTISQKALADAKPGRASGDPLDIAMGEKVGVNSLQRIGGGGGAGSGGDPLLSENQRQTSLLTKIEQHLATPPSVAGRVSIFG